MHSLARIALLVGIVGCWAAPLPAQWPNVVTRVPRTASGAPNLSAPAPKLADGKTPDFSGVWNSEKHPCNETAEPLGCIDAQGGIPQAFVNIGGGDTEVLPMQSWAEALVTQRKRNAGKDDPLSRCLPIVPARGWADFPLQKIIQTPTSLTILGEYMLQFRQIFLDGRRLPTNPEPTFKGYSVGKWDGDTLVVETIGFKDEGWLDAWGHPLTDQARTIERIKRVNYGTLQVQITVDDPKAYTKPWTVTRTLLLVPNIELLEYVCNENEKSSQHMVGADVSK
jgi:hypothetical protein